MTPTQALPDMYWCDTVFAYFGIVATLTFSMTVREAKSNIDIRLLTRNK